jgi:hypothetical protein
MFASVANRHRKTRSTTALDAISRIRRTFEIAPLLAPKAR